MSCNKSLQGFLRENNRPESSRGLAAHYNSYLKLVALYNPSLLCIDLIFTLQILISPSFVFAKDLSPFRLDAQRRSIIIGQPGGDGGIYRSSLPSKYTGRHMNFHKNLMSHRDAEPEKYRREFYVMQFV
jgi:hypothetical protein